MARRKTVVLIVLLSVVGLAVISFTVLSLLKDRLYDEAGATRRLRVASVSMACDVDPVVNRQKMVDTVRIIKREHGDVRLVLFGETITSWYSKGSESRQYHRSVAETIPGQTTAMLGRAAVECGLYVCFGMTEESGGKVYNSQVLIDPAGSVVAVHRKVNLQGSKTFDPGTVPVTMADIEGIRTAIIICSDIQNSSVRRALASEKPQLILGSLANPKDPGWFVSGLIGKMFGAWVVTANRYGDDGAGFFDGQMIVADPLGDLRVKAKDREQYITYDLGFDTRTSRVRAFAVSLYRWESIGVHFVKSLSMIFPSARK